MATRTVISAAAAREAARSVLAERRFHQPSIPAPLHGLLSSVGHAIESPLRDLGQLIDKLGAFSPFGVAGVWAALAILVLAAAGLIARVSARSRLAAAEDRLAAGVDEGPRELERAAVDAEREGRLADAVRLHFRAGLLVLADQRVIPSGRTVPSHEVALAVGSDRFEELARRFDEITYGGSPATAGDVERQREGWPRILAVERDQ